MGVFQEYIFFVKTRIFKINLIEFDRIWSSLIQFDLIDPKVHDYSKFFTIFQKNKNNNNKENPKDLGIDAAVKR